MNIEKIENTSKLLVAALDTIKDEGASKKSRKSAYVAARQLSKTLRDEVQQTRLALVDYNKTVLDVLPDAKKEKTAKMTESKSVDAMEPVAEPEIADETGTVAEDAEVLETESETAETAENLEPDEEVESPKDEEVEDEEVQE